MDFGFKFGFGKKRGASGPPAYNPNLERVYQQSWDGASELTNGYSGGNPAVDGYLGISIFNQSNVDESADLDALAALGAGQDAVLTEKGSNPLNQCTGIAPDDVEYFAPAILGLDDTWMQVWNSGGVWSEGQPANGAIILIPKAPLPSFSVTSPGDLTIPADSPQISIDAVFAVWLDGFVISEAGCVPSGFTLDPPTPTAPLTETGGSIEVTINGLDDCGQTDSSSSIFAVDPPS